MPAVSPEPPFNRAQRRWFARFGPTHSAAVSETNVPTQWFVTFDGPTTSSTYWQDVCEHGIRRGIRRDYVVDVQRRLIVSTRAS